MKKQIKTTEAIFPMPVLLIATFNEDGTVNVMNAAWGTMVSRDIVALNLTETHTTVQNIKARKGFVVHIADAKHVHCSEHKGAQGLCRPYRRREARNRGGLVRRCPRQ